jgi:hypothetical protein
MAAGEQAGDEHGPERREAVSSKALDVPELEGWMLLSDAAALLDVSRTSVHRMVRSGRIETCRRIPGTARIYVVRRQEIVNLINSDEIELVRKRQSSQSRQVAARAALDGGGELRAVHGS